MRILVAGGAGYIGSFMVRGLVEQGHQPVVIDDLSSGNAGALHDSLRFYKGDIGDVALMRTIFESERIEMVMLFAGKIRVGESVAHPDLYYDTNVVKTLGLLDTMRLYGVRKIIFSSTAAVYGEPEYLPIDENHPVRPINPYGKTKATVENILFDYHAAFGLTGVILRYFNAAGAALDGSMGESQAEKQNVVPIFLENIEKGKACTVFGDDYGTADGTCIRDYIHVEDIIAGHLKAIDYLGGNPCVEVFNLGSNSGRSVKEILSTLGRMAEKNGRVLRSEVGPRRPGDPAKLVASNGKARSVLGWEPKSSDLETILSSAYRWHFNRRY